MRTDDQRPSHRSRSGGVGAKGPARGSVHRWIARALVSVALKFQRRARIILLRQSGGSEHTPSRRS